jgi:hypothetical protein
VRLSCATAQSYTIYCSLRCLGDGASQQAYADGALLHCRQGCRH